MILIFGGTYQGKLDFAKDNFDISESDVFVCGEDTKEIPNAKVICNFEKYILSMLKDGEEVTDNIVMAADKFNDKIIIIDDISQGVVPTDKTLRAWREAVGRSLLCLSKEASQVYRVFCGIGERLK